MPEQTLGRRWQVYVARVQEEYARLPQAETDWIHGRLNRIAALQRKLDELFRRGGGPAACRRCRGDCCGCGKNHFTLANLLAFVVRGEEPPLPEFTSACPFLGPGGCRLEAFRRPFNCVTFICEGILDSLGKEGYDAFHALEKQLRLCYLDFDERYAGSSLRGLLIRGERLAGRPFLQRTGPL